MVSRKSTTPDLIAIYRLEFYRKQQNWKFGCPKHRDKTYKYQEDNSRNLLNATYNIDDNANEHDKVNPLNVAFCELDLEQKSSYRETNHQKHKELTQDWMEPINIWPDNVKKKTRTKVTNGNIPNRLDEVSYQGVCQEDPRPQDAPKKSWIHERLEVLMQAARNRDLEVQSEPTIDLVPVEQQPELNLQLEPEFDYEFDSDKNAGVNWDWLEYSRDNLDKRVWSEPGWMDMEQLMEDVWHRDLDVMEEPGDAWPADESAGSAGSLGGASDFIRGAHAAPHSSELDLAAPAATAPWGEAGASLSVLSASQLAAAVRSQSQLLARLLREAALRREIQNSLSLAAYSEFSSFEECPTRDVGPGPRDVVRAGSHRPGPGRGRGRLPDRS